MVSLTGLLWILSRGNEIKSWAGLGDSEVAPPRPSIKWQLAAPSHPWAPDDS